MLFRNPFTLNDWNMKEFLIVISSIQLIVFGLLGLDFIGIHIPLLRQIVILLYLIFVPGIVILRILRIHNIGNIETILYSIGLSIFCIMFLGFFINIFFPLLGIHKPLSIFPLTITIMFFIIILCVLAYLKDKDFLESDNIFIKNYNVQLLLFLGVIPFIAILGAYILNFYNINFALMFLIVLIGLIPILVAFDKIPNKIYPFAVFVMALSLLYHNSLISNYLTGYDIQIEYQLSNIVYSSGYWNSAFPTNVNAILSIPILAPIFAILCNINITWVLKIIYPFIFSFTPLGLYVIFKKQTNDKIAFFACFFFISIFGFYILMPQLARQEIGEFFIVLILMLIFNRNIIKFKNRFLLLIFSFSLIVSHYTLTYIFILILTLVLFISFLFQKNIFKEFLRKRNNNFQFISNEKTKLITLNFVILFIIFTLGWYMYTSSSSAFDAIVNFINNIFGSFVADFINPSSREVASIITGETSWTREITKYLFIITNLFIVFGIFSALFLKIKNVHFKTNYLLFSLATFVIWLMGVFIPNFSTWFTGRMYQITLLILAPFFIVGVMGFFKIICNKLFKLNWKEEYNKIVYVGLSLFLAIFLLFNSGLVYEIANDHPTSISFNSKIDSVRFSEPEVLGANWASSNTYGSVYGDSYGTLLILEFRLSKVVTFNKYTTTISNGSSLFFRNFNINGKMTESGIPKPVDINSTEFFNLVNQESEVYDNGKSLVFMNITQL